MRLLLIEDEPTLRESVAKKLRRSGYEMDDCGDGETALELLAAERYDLVLLDLNLPKVNGMTVPSGANGARVVVSRSQDGSTVVCENKLENDAWLDDSARAINEFGQGAIL